MKSGLFREHQAKYCQEIEELRRICCEEIDRARQAKHDELSMYQESNPTTVSQLLTQIQDLQNKANSLSDTREFYDPETASSTSPVNPRLFRVSENALPRIWIATQYTEYYGYFRKRF